MYLPVCVCVCIHILCIYAYCVYCRIVFYMIIHIYTAMTLQGRSMNNDVYVQLRMEVSTHKLRMWVRVCAPTYMLFASSVYLLYIHWNNQIVCIPFQTSYILVSILRQMCDDMWIVSPQVQLAFCSDFFTLLPSNLSRVGYQYDRDKWHGNTIWSAGGPVGWGTGKWEQRTFKGWWFE